jgi:molecular chaperone DnaJ
MPGRRPGENPEEYQPAHPGRCRNRFPLRLAGKGEGGARGGPAGDLYVVVHVKNHTFFQRHGDDIIVEMPIPFDVAVLGGSVEVPTVTGYATFKIPTARRVARCCA